MKKKRVAVLLVSLVFLAGITFLGGLCMSIEQWWIRTVLLAITNLCNGAVAIIAMKITGIKPEFYSRSVRRFAGRLA